MSRARDFADLAGSADAGGITGSNLIINGAMQVAQRGTSSTTNGYGSCDRFKVQYGGAGVTHSQESLSSSDSPYSEGFRYAIKLTNTSTSSATSAYAQVYQAIEAQNVAGSGWNYTSTSSNVTYQFWSKSSLAGTYTTFLKTSDGTSYIYSKDFTLEADTWKKITCTISGNSNLVVNNDTGSGLELYVVPHYGTDYTTSGHTDDAWIAYSNSDIAGDYAQSWANSSSATFFLTGWQFEVGQAVTPFEHRSYGDELIMCQRYYQSIDYYYDYGTTTANIFYYTNFSFPVTMRANPAMTASAYGANTGDAKTRYNAVVVNGWIMQDVKPTGCYMRGNHGNIYNYMVGRGKFDAEL
jgi:hypothetical protein